MSQENSKLLPTMSVYSVLNGCNYFEFRKDLANSAKTFRLNFLTVMRVHWLHCKGQRLWVRLKKFHRNHCANYTLCKRELWMWPVSMDAESQDADTQVWSIQRLCFVRWHQMKFHLWKLVRWRRRRDINSRRTSRIYCGSFAQFKSIQCAIGWSRCSRLIAAWGRTLFVWKWHWSDNIAHRSWSCVARR